MTIKYICTGCLAGGCKLWRQYGCFLGEIRLMCADCTEADQGKRIDLSEYRADGRSDQCGEMIPAVPTVENDTYWGYSSVPQDRVIWWKELPDWPRVPGITRLPLS
jgi:hypothetical protein